MSFKTRSSKSYAANHINGYYRKDTNHHIKGSDTAANRRTLVIVPFSVVIDDRVGDGRLDTFTTIADTEMDLNTAANWDSAETDYTVAATRAGKDFYIYACIQSGNVPKILLSANSTYPSGYTANNSRKIGGFHSMPYVTAPTWAADTVTTINYVVQPTTPGATKLLYRCTARADDYKTHATTEPTWPTTVGETVVDDQVTWTCDANGCENLAVAHPYYGYLMGDIIFNSIWDLLDRPRSSPEGMVKHSLTPSNGLSALWEDIYLPNGDGTAPTSVHAATIQQNVTRSAFKRYALAANKRLLTYAEFSNGAQGSNAGTCIARAANPTYAYFTVDTNGKSMISNIGIIGACGTKYQVVADLISVAHGLPNTGDPTFGYVTNASKLGNWYAQTTTGNNLYLALCGGAYNNTTNPGPEYLACHEPPTYTNAVVSSRYGSDPI